MTVAKSSFQLQENIQSFVLHFGMENCGLLTLTFSDEVQCVYEASKRFNSFRTGFLSKVANAYIGVYERTKRGRIHFHFVVAFPQNILWEYRNGRKVMFNHERVKKRDYRSRNKYLGQLWKQFREASVNYGFGNAMGTQIIPVYDAKGVGKYLAKYLTKGIVEREHRDKGFRLVRSTSGKAATAWKKVSGAFAFAGGSSLEWRKALQHYILQRANIARYRLYKQFNYYPKFQNELTELSKLTAENYSEIMKRLYGSRWCYAIKDTIFEQWLKDKEEATSRIYFYEMGCDSYITLAYDNQTHEIKELNLNI